MPYGQSSRAKGWNRNWKDDLNETPPWLLEWARACIDAGATMFVAHGVPILHGAPRLAHGEEASAILSRLAEISRALGTELEITGETAEVRLAANGRR